MRIEHTCFDFEFEIPQNESFWSIWIDEMNAFEFQLSTKVRLKVEEEKDELC